MSGLVLSQIAAPSTPSAAKGIVYLGTDGRLLVKLGDGSVIEAAGGAFAHNVLINGTFLYAQRQIPGTLTTFANTTGRAYGLDRWGLTSENASGQTRRVDTIAAPETGMPSRFYAEIKKITSAGKQCYSQVVEGSDVAPLRGRRVRLQCRAKNSVGAHTLRFGLLQLTSSGTVDTIPATFISAFNSASTDPTWGTNLAAVTPDLAGANASISGVALSCTLSSSWQQFSGVFTVPATAQNLVVVVFTNGQMAANDIIHLGDVGLFDGEDLRPAIFVDPTVELQRCQRFFSKTFDLEIPPVQNAGISGCARFSTAVGALATARSPTFNHPVRMRATPTLASYNPLQANAQARDPQASGDCSAATPAGTNDRCWSYSTTTHASTVAGNWILLHVSCDAEL